MPRLRRLLPALLLLTCAAGFLAQPLAHPTWQGSTDDWRWFHFHWEVSRTTVVDYGQLPGWNPYHCGGHVHLANPQTQLLSPLAWPALALGVPLGLKLFLVLHLLAGLAGVWWLGAVLGQRALGRAAAAVVFCFGGFFAFHVGGGHSAFLPFLYLPAMLAAFHLGLRDARWLAAVAGLLALAALEGGVYPLPYSALTLGVYALTHAVSGRSFGPLLRLAAAGGLGALVAGVKLVPVLLFLGERPRVVPSDDALAVTEVFQMFLSRRLERAYPGHLYVWPEYASYVGAPVLAAVGLLLLFRGRRYVRWYLILLVFSLLMMGNHGPWSPHEWLHALPVFRSLHVPSRLAVVVTLCLALLCGFAVHELAAWTAPGRWPAPLRRALRVLPVVFVVGVAGDLVTFGQTQLGRFTDVPRPGHADEGTAFRLTRDAWKNGPWLPRYRLATVACYEPNPVPRGKVRPGPAAFSAGGARGEVRVAEWSPNRVRVEGRLDAPGLVVLNQNDHGGWRLEGDGERARHRGMPAARLPSDRFVTTFVYRPPGLVPGLVASAAGLLLLGLLVRRRPTGRPSDPSDPAVEADRDVPVLDDDGDGPAPA